MAIQMPLPVVRDITTLLPVEYNPRIMSEGEAEDLQEGLDEFGLVQPLVVNTYPGRENRIIGGEQRWHRLIESGETLAPCVELSVPP